MVDMALGGCHIIDVYTVYTCPWNSTIHHETIVTHQLTIH
jgi:hypothetical protein